MLTFKQNEWMLLTVECFLENSKQKKRRNSISNWNRTHKICIPISFRKSNEFQVCSYKRMEMMTHSYILSVENSQSHSQSKKDSVFSFERGGLVSSFAIVFIEGMTNWHVFFFLAFALHLHSHTNHIVIIITYNVTCCISLISRFSGALLLLFLEPTTFIMFYLCFFFVSCFSHFFFLSSFIINDLILEYWMNTLFRLETIELGRVISFYVNNVLGSLQIRISPVHATWTTTFYIANFVWCCLYCNFVCSVRRFFGGFVLL